MKKTIILTSVNTSNYGAERSLVSLVKNILKKNNYNVLVIIPRKGRIINLFNNANIKFMVIPFQGNVNFGRGKKLIRGYAKYFINFFLALYLRYKLVKVFKDIPIKLVHSNTITSDFGAQLARFLGVPHIWHIREMAKASLNFDFELGDSYIKKMASKSQLLIFNSYTTYNYYKEFFKHKNMIIIHNGLSDKNKIKSYNSTDDIFRILLIGRLTSEKNHDIAIKACKYLISYGKEDFKMDIWGDGPDYRKLKKRIISQGLSKYINLMGYGKNIPIHEYTVGLNCSNYESFGRTTIEYMLAGIPVIAVQSGANSELITNETGFFYSKDNSKELANRLLDLYENPSLIKMFGIQGRERALNYFSEQAYVKNIIEQYDKL